MPRRLPPSERLGTPLVGPNVESYTVGSWCPTPDGTGRPVAVALSLQVRLAGELVDLVVRLKSPERVDQMIQALLRHKRDVWPDAS